MNNLQKAGGWAAIYEGVAYIIAIVGFLMVVQLESSADPVARVASILENRLPLMILYLISYVIWGVFMAVLSIALYERLKERTPALASLSGAFGLIWAGIIISSGMIYNVGIEIVAPLFEQDPVQAATVFTSIEAIHLGIGGGVEIVGGVWVLLLSWAALKSGALPRGVNYLGLVVAAAGIVSILPGLGEIAGMVFGVTQIVWFIWIGIAMIRNPAPAVAPLGMRQSAA